MLLAICHRFALCAAVLVAVSTAADAQDAPQPSSPFDPLADVVEGEWCLYMGSLSTSYGDAQQTVFHQVVRVGNGAVALNAVEQTVPSADLPVTESKLHELQRPGNGAIAALFGGKFVTSVETERATYKIGTREFECTVLLVKANHISGTSETRVWLCEAVPGLGIVAYELSGNEGGARLRSKVELMSYGTRDGTVWAAPEADATGK